MRRGRGAWGGGGAALGAAAILCLVGGCGDPVPTSTGPSSTVPSSTVPSSTPPAPSGISYRVVPLGPARTGRIEGRCALDRAVEPVEIRPGMGVDGPVPSESVNPGADVGLANCIVFLASIAEGKDWPADLRAEDRTAWIRILPGRYEPRAQWTRVETQLAFESRISMEINVHGYRQTFGRDTIFNFSARPGSKLTDAADLYLRRPGLVLVTDDCRGGFQAYVHVSPHPYVDVTQADATPERPAGGFRLDDVPTGAYELGCWHEGLAPVLTGDPQRPIYRPGPEIRLSRTVRVTAGAATAVDFVVPVPPAKGR